MVKIKAIFEITRPVNIILTFAVYLVSVAICSPQFYFTTLVFFAGIAASLVAAGGNIINDYFDIEIDRINRPNRPIPSGRLNKNEAIFLFLFFNFLALIISIILSYTIAIFIFVTIIILFLYSKFLKKIQFIGNITVALCTALVFIFGGLIAGNIMGAVLPAVFAFLINFIREILKDMEDIQGDKKLKLSTLPIKYGIAISKRIILIISLILIIVTFIPFITQYYKIEYLIIVLFSVDLLLIYFLRELFSKNFLLKLSKLSLVLKIIMIFGLVAIYLGAS